MEEAQRTRLSEQLTLANITRTAYGTRAVMALARARDMGTRHLLMPQNTGCHILSETTAILHACGLGSLAGSLRVVFTAGCAYYCCHLVGSPFIKWTSNVTG